ncbi:MAG: 2-C-methyl-D-erythritol 2,4-cyclodiphosphate synthase [Planctomycetota bacterium]
MSQVNLSFLRIGVGWDRHRLAPGRPLLLGGIQIPGDHGLAGHSDADVLLHAVIDALLGAAGEDDIGTLFPDTDPAFRGADSKKLTGEVLELVHSRGFQILSLDAVLAAERPKLAAYRPAIRASLASLLQADPATVNFKAKTGEGVGLIGRGEVMEATVVALLAKTS